MPVIVLVTAALAVLVMMVQVGRPIADRAVPPTRVRVGLATQEPAGLNTAARVVQLIRGQVDRCTEARAVLLMRGPVVQLTQGREVRASAAQEAPATPVQVVAELLAQAFVDESCRQRQPIKT